MRLLGVIKDIKSEPRVWMGQDGPVHFFQMIFEAEGNQFLGEYAIAPSRLGQLGIYPGVVCYLDIKFVVREQVSKTTGEVYLRQDIKFSRFSLPNANYQPEQEAAPKDDEKRANKTQTEAEVLDDAKEATEQAKVDGSDLPF